MGWQWWISQLFATISLIFLVISFQQSTSKRILIFKMISTLLTLVGTIFLGNVSAIILCAVGSYRNIAGVIFAYHPKTSKKVKIFVKLSVVFLLIFFNILFWVDYTNILSIIFGILLLIAFMQRQPENIRKYSLLANSFGIVYYSILLSPMNVSIELVGLISVIIGMIRIDYFKLDKNFSLKFLEYYEALKSMYVDDIVKYEDSVHIKSDIIDDGIWNFIYCPNDNVEEIFDKYKDEFVNRVPRVYILSEDISKSRLEELLNKYNTYAVDSWFCNDITKMKLKLRSDLKIKVELCKDKDVIIDTIMKGFSTGDPNDPYGDLSPTYKEALEKKLNFKNTIHLIAKYEGNVAGLASCTLKDNRAYLNNVTTLKQYKGHGIAKEIILNMIKVLKEKDINEIVFETIKGAYTEIFYKKLGFTVVEHGYCLEKK